MTATAVGTGFGVAAGGLELELPPPQPTSRGTSANNKAVAFISENLVFAFNRREQRDVAEPAKGYRGNGDNIYLSRIFVN